MELDAIDARWREIVNGIEDLNFDITECLKKYQARNLESKSTTQEQLEDYHRMLTAMQKIIDGN